MKILKLFMLLNDLCPHVITNTRTIHLFRCYFIYFIFIFLVLRSFVLKNVTFELYKFTHLFKRRNKILIGGEADEWYKKREYILCNSTYFDNFILCLFLFSFLANILIKLNIFTKSKSFLYAAVCNIVNVPSQHYTPSVILIIIKFIILLSESARLEGIPVIIIWNRGEQESSKLRKPLCTYEKPYNLLQHLH